MVYPYPVIWFVAGLIMIFGLRQENKIFTPAGIYSLFLGGWWLIDLLCPDYHIFGEAMGWVLRGMTAVTLAAVGVAFYREEKRTEATLEQDPQNHVQDEEFNEPEEQAPPQEASDGDPTPAGDSPDSRRED